MEREAALARMRHEEASLQSDDDGLRRLEQQLINVPTRAVCCENGCGGRQPAAPEIAHAAATSHGGQRLGELGGDASAAPGAQSSSRVRAKSQREPVPPPPTASMFDGTVQYLLRSPLFSRVLARKGAARALAALLGSAREETLRNAVTALHLITMALSEGAGREPLSAKRLSTVRGGEL